MQLCCCRTQPCLAVTPCARAPLALLEGQRGHGDADVVRAGLEAEPLGLVRRHVRLRVHDLPEHVRVFEVRQLPDERLKFNRPVSSLGVPEVGWD